MSDRGKLKPEYFIVRVPTSWRSLPRTHANFPSSRGLGVEAEVERLGLGLGLGGGVDSFLVRSQSSTSKMRSLQMAYAEFDGLD